MNGKKLSWFGLALLNAVLLLTITACSATTDSPAENIKYAGVRSSGYGITPFPGPLEWKDAMAALAGSFKTAQPTAIWIVGTVDTGNGDAGLEFPSPGGAYAGITFAAADRHESYLNYFDANGIKVFLQVEPGNAEVKTLIDLVLNRYGHHPCVAGFGIDVEWYRNFTMSKPGTPVTDDEAAGWEKEVKSYNAAYRLFLKHYLPSYLCPAYRGEVIFVADGQQFADINQFAAEMAGFAARFYPNTVFYQIGYASDKSWWTGYSNPVGVLGELLARRTRQDCGVIWVDFTLRDLLPQSI